ncbi:hypothetical protein N0V82_005567 [Gnomoniopsis sp. IMI 355080]|nr:hypothetical protein N0V82_005567 [Gnomoniopsis sp. IMI 355080]
MEIDPWSYDPSSAAAAAFMVFFSLATIGHIVILFRYRVWYFTPFIIGALFETVGYVFRFLGARDTTNLAFFVAQTLLILVAPALLAASIYMTLGRLITMVHGEALSPIRPSWLTKIFVGGDILSFVFQIIGSGSITSNFTLAKTVILVGLVVQILFFGLFIIGAAMFHRRLAANLSSASLANDNTAHGKGWRGVMHVLYCASALIFCRSVFRLIEFTGSSNSPMMTSEAYIYVCDSTLMLLCLIITGVFHPAFYIRRGKALLYSSGEELS